MGQKVHPLGFRLGIIQKHKSQWFTSPGRSIQFVDSNLPVLDEKGSSPGGRSPQRGEISKFGSSGQARIGLRHSHYACLVYEDKIIRDFFSQELREAGLSKVLISRLGGNGSGSVLIEIFVAQPKLVTGENGSRLKDLSVALQKRIRSEIRKSLQSKSFFYSEQKISLQIIQIGQEEIATDAKLLAQRISEQLEKRVAFRRVIKQSIQQARAAGVEGIKIQIAGRLNGAEIARSEWAREGRVPLQTLRANLDYCSHTAQTIYGVLGIKIWIFKAG
jgi:small subunit ribosomal protein S3